jgi:hypothetical protein
MLPRAFGSLERRLTVRVDDSVDDDTAVRQKGSRLAVCRLFVKQTTKRGHKTDTSETTRACRVKKFGSAGTSVLVIAVERVRLDAVLTRLLYRLLCWLVGLLARGGGERELEIVVLRHQLSILRRGGNRPQ